MRANFRAFLPLLLCAALPSQAQTDPRWTTPVTPFRIADDLYYVGSQDLASYLIVTADGNILINANLATSPPQIRASIEKLGFRWQDTKILLDSQAHNDHMGGAADIVRQTHAKNWVMDGDAEVVETGGRTDFIPSTASTRRFTPVHVDRVLHDGEVVRLGNAALTAHKTPGHTRGCTTWTLRAHLPGEPADQLRNIVIVGGVSFWSEYRLAATPGRPASYPGIAADFRQTFATLRRLPCEVFLGAHGIYFDLTDKLERYPAEGPRVFIDPIGYRDLIADAERDFEQALRQQRAGD